MRRERAAARAAARGEESFAGLVGGVGADEEIVCYVLPATDNAGTARRAKGATQIAYAGDERDKMALLENCMEFDSVQTLLMDAPVPPRQKRPRAEDPDVVFREDP